MKKSVYSNRKVWILSLAFLLLAIIITGYRLSNSRSFQVFGKLIDRVETKERVIALTFDDGPTDKTGEILEILDRVDVKATFFVTGHELENHMEEGRRIVEAGHELGNHSYSHHRMVFKSPSFIQQELELTDYFIREAGYKGEIHFRPPYAKKLVLLPFYLMKNNKRTIMWNLEPDSYRELASCSQSIIDYTMTNIVPGSILLLHVMYESNRPSLDSIEAIVHGLMEKGYSFLTVSELLEYKTF